MRVLRHKSICSGCFRKLSQGLYSSSSPNLEDSQQVSPCDCSTVPDSTLSNPSTNGHVKSFSFLPSSPSKLENEIPDKGSKVDADDAVESSSSIDDDSLVTDGRDEQAFDGGAEENEIGEAVESDCNGVRVLNSILKKGRKSSSSGSNFENRRVRWLPDDDLTQVREFDRGSNEDEDDERRSCGCIIL
ncbi:hypothetical protein ZOSMA_116G00780 [Zostera marina]|uniref:Uncharacterized protein n=1 Tax=Zostera marina TaxID=29655 RepID=A0A0K9Q233_ZOSMR|nr:hypothetical protein ZOSMA_116G00780 [Zostera marina]